MEHDRSKEHDGARGGNSLWDELAEEPLMEPSEAIEIKRGFFKTLFGTFYDRLGGLILLNLAVTVQLGLGVLLGFLIAALLHAPPLLFLILVVLGGGLFAAPAWAGLFNYVRAISDPDSLSSFRDYTDGMRRYARRSWVLLAIQAGSGALLALNLYFYASIHSVIGLALEFLILLLLLVWAMAGVYVWPLLVRDLAWRALLRNALFLALAAPFSTVAILLSLGVLSLLLTYVTRVLWTVALFNIWALTENVALQRLVRIFRDRQAAATADPEQSNPEQR
jgi:uncharacterized membrane protein YesL